MSRKGFTLLEVLIAVVVIAILASAMFALFRFIDRQNVSATEMRVHGLGVEVGKVLGAKGAPPARLEDLPFEQPGWMEGGKYVDNWGRPFVYKVSGKKFELWSCGLDGVSGTADDLPYRRN